MLIKAHNLRQVDESLKVHQLAFLNMAVKSTRKNGKPVYSNFNKFFNYDKELERVTGKVKKDDRFADIGKFLRRGGVNGSGND